MQSTVPPFTLIKVSPMLCKEKSWLFNELLEQLICIVMSRSLEKEREVNIDDYEAARAS